MRDKFYFLTSMSLKKKIKSKWFLIANIVLALAIMLVVNIDSVINFFGGDFNEKQTISVIADDDIYNIFELNFEEANKIFENMKPIIIDKTDLPKEELLELVKEENNILLEFNNKESFLVELTSNQGIGDLLYQTIISSINSTKTYIEIEKSSISFEELQSIYEPAEITENVLDVDEKSNELLMGAIFPIIILPFFMLSIYLVQMIGAEINDEKTTRGMEIIIGNVSPRIHFLSKVIAGNAFVLIQGLLLFIYGSFGFLIRNMSGGGSLIESFGTEATSLFDMLIESGFIDKLPVIIPITLILMALSFVAYSLLAGILASMTTSIEDFQQLQAPIIFVSVIGYYLSIMSTMFKGALFIKIMSYIPFVSALLSPALLVLGEITLFDTFISIGIISVFNYLLIKYGLKVYKVGILNYSSSKLWTRMYEALKRG